MSPRERRKPIFDESALDDLDELWPATQPQQPQPAPPTPAQPSRQLDAPATIATTKTAPPPAPAAAAPPRPAPPRAVASEQATRSRPITETADPAPSRDAAKRARPPEVLLSAEVYDELYRVQIAEKKSRKSLARTMGQIVMDAIEAHADRLVTTWTVQEYAVGEGQLFERPASTAVPRRRRHAKPPRTVVLSGVTAANGQRLDNLVAEWNAGTRSALVEQALRYEFDLTG
jgi:hypothetical protein